MRGSGGRLIERHPAPGVAVHDEAAVLAGSLFEAQSEKVRKVQDHALKVRAPISDRCGLGGA